MTLTQLFTSIANALRSAKGTTGTIKAENFPNEINGLNDTTDATATSGDVLEDKTAYADGQKITGTYRWDNTTDYDNCLDKTIDILEDDTYQPAVVYPPNWGQIGYSTTPQRIVDDFNYAKTIYDNWDNTITSMNDMYLSDRQLEYMPLVDTSNVTSMNSTFKYAALQIVPLLNTSNVTNMNALFYSTAIKSIPQLDTSKVQIFWGMFYGCGSLISVPVLDTSKGTNFESMFKSCNNLSNDSLNNILTMCANASTYTGTKTLKYIGLSSSQATTCTGLSNWTAAQTAGWTTGY